MPRDPILTLTVSLGNSISLSLFLLPPIQMCFALSVVFLLIYQCSFPPSESIFSCLILLIHLSPQLQALICPLGFPHFYPFSWGGSFSGSTDCFLFPPAFAGADGFGRSRIMPWSKACPVPSSTQTLAPLRGSWHSIELHSPSSAPPGEQRKIPAATCATGGRLKADPKGLQWVRVYKHKGALMQPDLGGISAPMGSTWGGVLDCKYMGAAAQGCVWVEMGLGWHSPPIETLSVGLGRRMLRSCAPYSSAVFATNWRAGFGQHEHSGTVQYQSQVIAFKAQGVWMCFVGWDLDSMHVCMSWYLLAY